MKKIFFAVIAMMMLTFAFSYSASAQMKKKVKVNSKAVDMNRGSNPNIKMDAPTTDEKVAKSRGTCGVWFYNHTGYYVKIYLDGNYKGELSPYTNASVYVGDGYTTIYCITAGGTRDWSASGNCTGIYTYDLY